jgi:hypothetical protein
VADAEFGYHCGIHCVVADMDHEVRRVLEYDATMDARSLQPDWRMQQCRVVVPCRGTEKYEWRRSGIVVTLGWLFKLLGPRFSAATIHYFYRTLHIVALKRRPGKSGKSKRPETVVGTTGSSLQASKIKSALQTEEENMVQEYSFIIGHVGEVAEAYKKDMFAAAVRYMHMILLQDLRPPWLTHKFPQALPGDGVLSRYTRPSFLTWSVESANVLFGEKVMTPLGQVAEAVSVSVAGILARPLYLCTGQIQSAKKKPELCMALASMSHSYNKKVPWSHVAKTEDACSISVQNVPCSLTVQKDQNLTI